jgi:hypothetical protein
MHAPGESNIPCKRKHFNRTSAPALHHKLPTVSTLKVGKCEHLNADENRAYDYPRSPPLFVSVKFQKCAPLKVLGDCSQGWYLLKFDQKESILTKRWKRS